MPDIIVGLIVAVAFYYGCRFLDAWQKEHKEAVPARVGFLVLMGILLLVGGLLRHSFLFSC